MKLKSAIRLKSNLKLIECINILLNSRHDRGYVGHWPGQAFWSNGFCTEALQAIIKFGFEEIKLNKTWAEHKTKNIGSGRGME